MQKSFTTEAINLKSYPLNDNDSIIVMFSKTRGLLRAVAKGVKRPKSKLGARAQMFVANELMLYEGKNLDVITQASSLNTFSKIRYDLNKLSYSMYIAELVNNFCSDAFNCEDENYENIYSLIFDAYNAIADSKSNMEIMLSVLKFQLKFMLYLGWGLDFNYCSKCQKPLMDDKTKSAVFSYSTGGFLCDDCMEYTASIRIHNKIRIFLDVLAKADYNKKTMYDDLLTPSVVEKCFDFMKKYIDNLSNKKIKVFDVLENMEAAL